MTIRDTDYRDTSPTPSRRFRRPKDEPTWMLDLRLKAWRFFEEIPWPTGTEETWRRTKLTGFKLEDYQPLAGRRTRRRSCRPRCAKSLAEIDSIGTLAIVDGATRRARAGRRTWRPGA